MPGRQGCCLRGLPRGGCFNAALSVQRHAELIALLDGIIHHSDDHVILVDVGLADQVVPRVVSLGKTYSAVEREPVTV